MTRWVVANLRARRSHALHRLPPGLQNEQSPTDAARNPQPRPHHRPRQRRSPRYTATSSTLPAAAPIATVVAVSLIERDWYRLGSWNLDDCGRCLHCGSQCAGRFVAHPAWGPGGFPSALQTEFADASRPNS